MMWGLHLILGALTFVLGTVVGSFLNVCIYRLPWQKSVIWPGSRCPRCWAAIASFDNIPVISWLALRGECRQCGVSISARYPLVEALVGLLFLGVYLVDVVHGTSLIYAPPFGAFAQMAYHQVLLALLVVAAFIDFELYVIPDEVTVPGMVVGLVAGALVPGIRPEPSESSSLAQGLGVGLIGWAVGGGLVWFVRIVGGKAFGREAMGFGDVTLLSMIGAFLGWQAAVLTFFLGAFLALGHAIGKIVAVIGKRIAGQQLSSADREIPFGPYLSMAAITLMLSWPWLWKGWAKEFFHTFQIVFWFMLGKEG
jgi:leader peptidase (prepilin peptidase) / N-methyltransferase